LQGDYEWKGDLDKSDFALIGLTHTKQWFSFNELGEILQLHYLRDRLTSGLQTHFVHNTMIHTILPSTAILYSPTQATNVTFTSGSRLAAATISQSGSKAGSRAGSRPSSSLGIYADAEDAKAEQLDKVDRRYLNAEMAKMRQVQRKKERSREKYDD